MIFFFIFLSLFCTADTMYAMDDFTAFANKQSRTEAKSPTSNFDENIFTLLDKLKKCSKKEDFIDSTICKDEVLWKAAKSTISDLETLRKINATLLIATIAHKVSQKTDYNNLSSAIGASKAILQLSFFVKFTDCLAKILLLNISS